MSFTDRFSDAPMRDEQIAAVIDEVERLTPEARRIGQIGAEADGPQSVSWQDWYETPKGGIVTVHRSFITTETNKDGTVPTTLESWGVKLDSRRGEQVGEFVLSNTVELKVERKNSSEADKARRAYLARGVEVMKAIGIEPPESAPGREMRTNPGLVKFSEPDKLHALVTTVPRIFDKDGFAVFDTRITDLGMKAADALANYQSDAYPLLHQFNVEGMREHLMKQRMAEVASRKIGFQVIHALQQLNPDNRLQRTPFARPSERG